MGLAGATGCGSSDNGALILRATAAPTPTATATPLPLAPAKAVPLVETIDPNLPHWFILVNGQSVPSPMALFTPTVLTVNGAGPAGSPNPNSGTAVGLTPMQFVSNPVSQPSPSAVPTAVPFSFSGAQVWEAVKGTQSGYDFLRSGESFTVDRTNNPLGSLMLGYAATEALLELGYLPSWNTGIYLDQSTSPTGDNSCFEQWSYEPKTAQLTNCNGGQLYGAGSTVAVGGSGTSAPGNQWYPLPNYELVAIVTAPNSSPPFPPWTGNQQNAYNWVSAQPTVNAAGPCFPVNVGIGKNQQTLCLTGVRNEYQNSNFQTGQANSNIQALKYPRAAPSPYFAPADLAAVQQQLDIELTFVGNVQKLIGNIHTVISTVFIENTNVLTKVIADLGVSDGAMPYAVAGQIAEGTVYTGLSALGGSFAVAANVMQTAIDTTAITQPTFAQKIGGTVGELAGNLNTQFNYLNDALTADYNTIVYDWARLKVVGPETQQYGYWGLGWPDTLTGIIVPYMVNGYQISVMRSLLPLVYNVHEWVGSTASSVVSTPSWAQYAWPFGSGRVTPSIASTQTNWASYYNIGDWETGGGSSTFQRFPDSTVMLSDLLDLGANPFEVFTGINGWSGNGTGTVYYSNLTCSGVAVTLFNGTPTELWANYTPNQGELSGPGVPFSGGTGTGAIGGYTGPVTTELRPYGYTTMFFAQETGHPHNQTGTVAVFDPAYSVVNPVAYFQEGQDGCFKESETNIFKGAFTVDNYSWAGGLHVRGQSTGEPGGIWGTLINSAVSPPASER